MGRRVRDHRHVSTFNATNPESGQLDRFKRSPNDLAKYLSFKAHVLQTYPSIEKHILVEKLHWSDPPERHSEIPYSDPRRSVKRLTEKGDYQIRLNDHPYAFTSDITHIVVWSAVPFPSSTDHQQRMKVYEQFVKEHFREIPGDRRKWFLNWGSIQSVPGLEVFGCLLTLTVALSCFI